jgi:hypothetical protein
VCGDGVVLWAVWIAEHAHVGQLRQRIVDRPAEAERPVLDERHRTCRDDGLAHRGEHVAVPSDDGHHTRGEPVDVPPEQPSGALITGTGVRNMRLHIYT